MIKKYKNICKLATLFFGFVFLFYCKVNIVNAQFYDLENSEKNSFSATSLDMTLSSDTENYQPDTLIFPGSSLERDIAISNVSDLSFDYFVDIEFTGGNDDLCSALIFNSTANGNLSNGNSDNLNFTVSLPPDASYELSNKTCEFNINAYAWQPELGSYDFGFTDSEILQNIISTGDWTPEEPDQDNEYYQKVVINEVMWMGSTINTNDEWIELRNMTSEPIDLTNWTIENALVDHGTYIIPSGIIPANGYFLISNYDSGNTSSALNIVPDIVTTSISLSNENNGNLILKDENNNLIDNALAWASGENLSLKRSMERNSTPGDGLLSENWHSCIDTVCNDSTYWDIHDGDNYGTPKLENHSDNDLSVNPIFIEKHVLEEQVIEEQVIEEQVIEEQVIEEQVIEEQIEEVEELLDDNQLLEEQTVEEVIVLNEEIIEII